MTETTEIPEAESSDARDRYFELAKELLNIRNLSENIIAVHGRICQENLIIPLAAFIEWAAANDTGHLALLFPTISEAWCALEGVEAFFSFNRPLIKDIDKRKREFYIGNKRFAVCSNRSKEEKDLDISGGMFIYRVGNTPKICEMYRRIDKRHDYKILSVHSNKWVYCVQNRNAVESKIVKVINTPFIDPLHPRFFGLLPPDERELLLKEIADRGCSGSLDMQGLYWNLEGHN